MTPYYSDSAVTIYNCDCREILPDLPKVDLVLTDPPYGIGAGTKSFASGTRKREDTFVYGDWDKEIVWLPSLLRGRYSCVWGGQYYADTLRASESWLVWLKRPAGFDDDSRTYAPLEMAWTNYGGKPRTKTIVWDGGKRQGNQQNRHFCHPTQKPLELMIWCIEICPDNPQTILDPFMGSGTTLRAAKDLGRKAIGIEIEEKYCEIAAQRMAQEVLSL